jgi:hypothetical protein
MVSERLFEKIRDRVGKTPEERQARVSKVMEDLNKRLERQMLAQVMTPEVLAKSCTL